MVRRIERMLEAFKVQNRWEFRKVKGFDLVG